MVSILPLLQNVWWQQTHCECFMQYCVQVVRRNDRTLSYSHCICVVIIITPSPHTEASWMRLTREQGQWGQVVWRSRHSRVQTDRVEGDLLFYTEPAIKAISQASLVDRDRLGQDNGKAWQPWLPCEPKLSTSGDHAEVMWHGRPSTSKTMRAALFWAQYHLYYIRLVSFTFWFILDNSLGIFWTSQLHFYLYLCYFVWKWKTLLSCVVCVVPHL